MRKFILSFGAVCFYLTLFADDALNENWGAETNGIQMSIQQDKNPKTNSASHDVVLLFRLKNVTTNTTFETYQMSGFANGYGCSFEVIFPSGKKLSLPAQHYSGSGRFVHIKPKQCVSFVSHLDKIIALNETGIYQVVATKDMLNPETGKPFAVVSNPLKIDTARRNTVLRNAGLGTFACLRESACNLFASELLKVAVSDEFLRHSGRRGPDGG